MEYEKVPYEIEEKATDEVKRLTAELMKKLAKDVHDVAWQVANDYIREWAESDSICNLRDALRNEVIRCSHSWARSEKDFYGQEIRKSIFEEHKEEILPLIQNEHVTELTKEVARLKEQLEFIQKMQRY